MLPYAKMYSKFDVFEDNIWSNLRASSFTSRICSYSNLEIKNFKYSWFIGCFCSLYSLLSNTESK